MRTPPPADQHVMPVLRAAPERDARFLVFVGVVLVALALGFKSELVPAGQVWMLGAGLLLLSVPALIAYLTAGPARPELEHFIPVALGSIALAGLSLLVTDWWKYWLVAIAFGLCFYLAARLDYRGLRQPLKPGHVVIQEVVIALGLSAAFLVVLAAPFQLPLRLACVFGLGLLATYRSFRVLGQPMPGRRALLFSVFVAQLLTFFAWAMTAYVYYAEGTFAVMLFLVWYVNRGIIRHTVEESLSRNVLVEYGLFALLIGYLFFISFRPPASSISP